MGTGQSFHRPRAMPTPTGRSLDLALDVSVILVGAAALARLLTRGLLPIPLAWPAPWGWVLHLGLLLALLSWRVRRAIVAGEPASLRRGLWLSGLRPPELVIAGTLLLVLAALPPPIGTLGADGDSYLKQLQDALLHGELLTMTGVEPGTVLVWAPFFLIGHGLALLGLGRDVSLAPEASHAYRAALAVSGPVYGFLAVVFAHRIARRFFPSLLAAACAAGAWLASTLFHYSVAEPLMPHAPGAALVSLLLLLWIRAREEPRRFGRWLAAAAVGGLVVSLQRYDVYFLLPLAWDGVLAARKSWRSAGDRRLLITRGAALAGAFLLCVLPLLLLAASKPDGGLLSPDYVRTVMVGDWKRLHLLEILYSSNGGLFVWTPWALFAVAGLLLFARRHRRVGGTLVATLAAGFLLLATSPQWTAGWSFGARRLTEAFPVLLLGFCALAQALLRRPWILGVTSLVALAGVNVLASYQVRQGEIPRGDTVRFANVAEHALTDAYAAVGHPPAWPLNWLFAARYGVTPDRFDDLYGRLSSRRVHLDPAREDVASLLGSGWWLRRQPAPALWATGREASLLVSLPPSAGGWRLGGRAAGAADTDGRLQAVEVAVNGRFVGAVSLTVDPTSFALVVPAPWWKPGLNGIRFEAEWTLPRGRGAALDSVPPFAAWRLDEMTLEPIAER